MSAAERLGTRLLALVPPGQVLRFAVVGIAATATHFVVLNLLVQGGGLDPVPANGAAFLGAVGVTYTGQSLWVFRQPLRGGRRLHRFLVSAVGGLVANIALMALFVDGFGWHYNLGFACALVIVPATQFLVNKFWVFREARAE